MSDIEPPKKIEDIVVYGESGNRYVHGYVMDAIAVIIEEVKQLKKALNK